MNSTRDKKSNSNSVYAIRNALGAAIIACGSIMASQAWAETVSIQFSQTFPGGGTVTGLIVGEDLNGDGRLYTVAPPLAGFLGIEGGGEEVTYASVRIEGVLGQTVTNVFDASVADINDESNFFWGFAHNLDGGQVGDDANEGLSFAPLAPSTSYTVGALFAGAVTPSVIPDPIGACGNAEGIACGAITTLNPVDPFPNFDLLFAATSSAPVETNDLLRYTFEQDGFDGGASIRGTISGRDLDGDGRIYSASPPVSGALSVPTGDEVVFAQVEILGVEPLPIVNVQDLVTDPIDSFAAFFFLASVNVAGDQLGDEPGEGLSIAPFSPSTSVVIGDAASPIFFPSFDAEELTTCGDDELGCSALVTLVPDPDEPTGARLVGLQRSAEPVALTPAPFLVDSSFSGTWNNLIPNGEGIILQFLNDGRVLAFWVTYDDAGNQRWLYGVGRQQGLKVVVDSLLQTEGGVFGTEMPVVIDQESVGEFTIEFSGCSQGQVQYTVDGVPGTMSIGRLAVLDDLECFR